MLDVFRLETLQVPLNKAIGNDRRKRQPGFGIVESAFGNSDHYPLAYPIRIGLAQVLERSLDVPWTNASHVAVA